MYLVALVVFMNITRVASIYGFIEVMQLPLLLTILASLVMFGQISKWGPADLSKHWIPKLVLVVLLFAILGIPTGLHRGASFTILTHGFSQSLLGGILVFGVARTDRGRRLLAQTFVVSGIVTGMLALIYSRRDRAGRLAGAATYDPNDLALIVVITMPLLLWWFFDNRSKLRWLAVMALPMLFSIMLRTNSRGGFLGMVAIFAGLLFVGSTGRVREVRRIAIAGILVAVLGMLAMPADYVHRMMTMDEEIDNKSPTARINVWKRGIGYAMDNPILGVGIGNFGRAEGILSEYSQSKQGMGVKWKAAHSSYVQAWAEIGLIGGTAFAVAIVGSMLALMLWRPPPWMRDPAQRMLMPMVGLSIAAFGVAGAFLSFAFDSPPYYLLGFATALLLVRAVKGAPQSWAPGHVRGMASPPRSVRPPLSRFPAPPPLPTPRRSHTTR